MDVAPKQLARIHRNISVFVIFVILFTSIVLVNNRTERDITILSLSLTGLFRIHSSLKPIKGIFMFFNSNTTKPFTELRNKSSTHLDFLRSHKVRLLPTSPLFIVGVPQTFEVAEGLSSTLYVYGALWNVQNVRLTSIKVQGYNFKHLLCVFYSHEGKKSEGTYVKAIVQELHTYKSPYTSASIKCPIRQQGYNKRVSLFVGLVESKQSQPKKVFYVENRNTNNIGKNYVSSRGIPEREASSVEFTVCVPAMFNLSNAAQLVEHVEMIRLLGARRLVLYNASISTNVDSVLRMYAREWEEGRETLQVVVLPWALPLENGTRINIPYWAQQLAIDDCMCRYKRLSKFMVFNDLDEFLIPLKHANWSALVAERRRLKPQSIGWLFRSSVMNKDTPSPAPGFEEDSRRYGSSVLGLTMRDSHIYPPDHRPKLIVDPTTIEEMGVHLIWEGGGSTDNLPVDVGLLFHYRAPLSECRARVKETRVVTKYGKRLKGRLKQVWSKLPGVKLGTLPFKGYNSSKCKLEIP
ncbi:hypothetical protein EGW08_014480 [Elysia chlorotica]|uniref:Glycosyltransferase family 92 protein n=1 Tax=Elysia chlorotica TaxID=188477 RepID=A0A3S1BCY0_ELYCH|nr:hypothetical protein EGW08_014480 [Elysia chlorotica]